MTSDPEPKRSSTDYNFTDYSFVDPPTPKPTPLEPLSDPNRLLVQAGLQIGVLSLKTGQNHPILQAAAQFHADFQAKIGVQGHQNWDRRCAELFKALPECNEFKEVANESWPDQDAPAAAEEMYKSWRQSPGHWSAVNGRCSFYGYAMSFDRRNNTWYACGVFGNLRANEKDSAYSG